MSALLTVERLATGYGRVEVLHGIDLVVPKGTVVAVLGPNGVGKTTLLRAIAGVLPAWRGAIRLGDRRIDGAGGFAVARAGVTLIPEGRGVFPSLTVRENLDIARRPAAGSGAAQLAEVLDLFPRLAERSGQLAKTLSGGEQQMLAMSRAFLSNPSLLLIDELSMGLAPLMVDELFERVGDLKRRGQTIVLVEQYLTYALGLADICYLLQRGQVVFAGEPSELRSSDVLSSAYLGVA